MKKNYQTSTSRAATPGGRHQEGQGRRLPPGPRGGRRVARHGDRRHGRARRRARGGPARLRRRRRAQGARRHPRRRGHGAGRAEGTPRPGALGRAPRQRRRAGDPGRPPGAHHAGPGCALPTAAEVHCPTYELARRPSCSAGGHGAHAGQGVHPPLRRRPRTRGSRRSTARTRSGSESAVSRRFVAATETALAELMAGTSRGSTSSP